MPQPLSLTVSSTNGPGYAHRRGQFTARHGYAWSIVKLPAARHRIAGVDHEVEQHLFDVARIRQDLDSVASNRKRSSMSSPISRRNIFSQFDHDDIEVENARAARSACG